MCVAVEEFEAEIPAPLIPAVRRIPIEALEQVVAACAVPVVRLTWIAEWCSGTILQGGGAMCFVLVGCGDPREFSLCKIARRADADTVPGDGCTPCTPHRGKNWENLFFNALATTGSVKRSAALAGVSARTVYNRRLADLEFAARWEIAIDRAASGIEGYRRQDLIAQGRAGAVSGILAFRRSERTWHWINWDRLVQAKEKPVVAWEETMRVGRGDEIEFGAIIRGSDE